MIEVQVDDSPRLVLSENRDSLPHLLLEGQRILVRYPQAARALIAALVAEGRVFASTPEGQVWKDKLSQSDLVRRGRFIWDAYCLDALLESEDGRLPSAWLDIILAAVGHPDLETILSNLVVEEVKHGSLGII